MLVLAVGWLFVLLNIGLIIAYKHIPKIIFPLVVILLVFLNLGSHLLVEHHFIEKYKNNETTDRAEIANFYNYETKDFKTILATDEDNYVPFEGNLDEAGITRLMPYTIILIVSLVCLSAMCFVEKGIESTFKYFLASFWLMMPVSICILQQLYDLIFFNKLQFFIEFGLISMNF